MGLIVSLGCLEKAKAPGLQGTPLAAQNAQNVKCQRDLLHRLVSLEKTDVPGCYQQHGGAQGVENVKGIKQHGRAQSVRFVWVALTRSTR